MQLNDKFDVEPGNGGERDQYLADHRIKTYLIVLVNICTFIISSFFLNIYVCLHVTFELNLQLILTLSII